MCLSPYRNYKKDPLPNRGRAHRTGHLGWMCVRVAHDVASQPHFLDPFADAVRVGAELDYILEPAGVQPKADRLRLVGGDGYARVVFPALNGNNWVKWLLEIEVY